MMMLIGAVVAVATTVFSLLAAAAEASSSFHIDAGDAQFLVAGFIPLLVALVTKWKTTSAVKGVVNLFLTALSTALLHYVDQGGDIVLRTFIRDLFMNFAISVTSYQALWSKSGVADSIAVKTAGFGIGSPPALQTKDVGAGEVGEALAVAEAEPDSPAAQAAIAEVVSPPDLDGMTTTELETRARVLDIPGRSSMRRQQLIDAIRAHAANAGK